MITEIGSLAGSGHEPAKKPTDLGQDEFLNLLVTQLTNQDPLEPMDSTEFVTQLAQFSELEEIQKVSSGMEQATNYLGSANNFSAVTLLGKEIEFTGDRLHYDTGSESQISFDLGREASLVTVNVYDELGNLVRTIEEASMMAGRQEIVWNGYDQDGNPVNPGTYRFEIIAQDLDKNEVPVQTIQQGTVDKVEFVNGLPYLSVGDQVIALADIQGITN
jgi:flagellar basal-body rod modification protein FlgD